MFVQFDFVQVIHDRLINASDLFIGFKRFFTYPIQIVEHLSRCSLETTDGAVVSCPEVQLI